MRRCRAIPRNQTRKRPGTPNNADGPTTARSRRTRLAARKIALSPSLRPPAQDPPERSVNPRGSWRASPLAPAFNGKIKGVGQTIHERWSQREALHGSKHTMATFACTRAFRVLYGTNGFKDVAGGQFLLPRDGRRFRPIRPAASGNMRQAQPATTQAGLRAVQHPFAAVEHPTATAHGKPAVPNQEQPHIHGQ